MKYSPIPIRAYASLYKWIHRPKRNKDLYKFREQIAKHYFYVTTDYTTLSWNDMHNTFIRTCGENHYMWFGGDFYVTTQEMAVLMALKL